MGQGIIVAFIVMIVAVTAYKIIELKHKPKKSVTDSEEFRHMLAEELADRDDKANALEERIRVLEKIVTDNHKSSALSEEIDSLDDQANG